MVDFGIFPLCCIREFGYAVYEGLSCADLMAFVMMRKIIQISVRVGCFAKYIDGDRVILTGNQSI